MNVDPAALVPAQGGNREFEQLFRQEFRRLVAAMLSLPGISLEEAKDAAQAGLEDVLARWPALANPRAYAYKATISHLWKIKNGQRRQDQIRQRQIERGEVGPETCQDAGLAAVEFHQWVLSALDGLAPTQREAVALCLVDELQPAEAASLLGKSGPALRQALHAGRRALQRRLAAEAAAEAAAAGSTVGPATLTGHGEVR